MKHRISQTGGKEAQNLSRIPLQSDLFRSKKENRIPNRSKDCQGSKRKGERRRRVKRSEREQEKRAPVYLFFRKVNKNFAGPARASNEGTVDDGRAKCSWPTGQNEFVSIITLHPAVSHEPARGPVIQPSTGCSRRCSTDFLVNIKVVH